MMLGKLPIAPKSSLLSVDRRKYSELEIEDFLKLFRQEQLAKYLENQQPSGDK